MADLPDTQLAAETISAVQNSAVQQSLSGTITANEFKRKSVRGGAAALIGQGVSMALQIGTTLILARLLSPADYGLQAMVLTLTGFFSLFKDAGLSVATVQREHLTHEQISTLFWINLVLGTILTAMVAAMGPLLVAFYKDPRLLWLTVASSTVFLFNSLAVQHRALLDRSMRFTVSAKIDILCATIGSVIAVSMAMLGCGYWSLIGQNISLPIIGTAAVWIVMPWLPGRPRWSQEMRSMVRFGGTVTLNSLVVYLGYNTEKILLGRFWGAGPLGIYGRAYQLANLPVQQLSGSVGVVAFPVLARMQNDPSRLRRSYLKFHSVVVSLTVPVVISCTLFADEIVRTMLGPKWAGTAIVLRLLSPTVLIFALMNPLSWLLRATGRVERSLKIALLIAPIVVLGVTAGLHYGPSGVALGYSTAMILLVVPLVAWAKHGTGVTTSDYWDCIKRPLIAGVIGGVAGYVVQILLKHRLPPIPLLACELTTFSAVYAAALLFVIGQKDFYVDLMKQILRRGEESATS